MAALSQSVDSPEERVVDKVILVKAPSVKCPCCDILLEGREQFIGHMVHGHEMPVGETEKSWDSAHDGLKCILS